MYTKGILKIFVPPAVFSGSAMKDVFKVAANAGFTAVAFGGRIFIKDGSKWIGTTFYLADFEA
jgi:hypothetical protein